MSSFGTKRTGRRVFSSAWMYRVTIVVDVAVAMAVTVAAAGAGAVSGPETLHPSSGECTNNNTTLVCEAQDSTTEYRLDNFHWNDIRKVIIHNATRLVLEEPLCSDTKMEVEVHYSAHVTTERGKEDCALQLVLQNCADVVIEDGVNLVRMIFSKAQKIDLPRVSQFDLQDSWVKEVSVHVDKDKSTFVNSEIEVVKKLVIDGSFHFGAENSTLARVEHLEFRSRGTSPTLFKNVKVGSVSSKGFLMHEGVLTLEDCSIGNVASKGLSVIGGAELVIENSIFKSAVYDSILVSQGGKVSFKNVTVGQESEIFFSLSEANTPIFPLAILGQFRSSPFLAWIVLSLFLGLGVGGAAGVAVILYVLRWRGTYKGEADGTELLATDLSNPTVKHDLKPDKNNHVIQSSLNQPKKDHVLELIQPGQNRPLPDVPKDLAQESDDEDLYIDVQPTSTIQSSASQRPPKSIPEENPSTGESTPSMTDQALTKPVTRPNTPMKNDPKLTVIKDDRDVLPPPPVPSEMEQELYDDPTGFSGPMHPLPPPLSNKPLLPLLKPNRPPPTPIRNFKY